MRSSETKLWSAVAEGGTTGDTAFGLPVENSSSFPIHTSPTCFPSEQYSKETSGRLLPPSTHEAGMIETLEGRDNVDPVLKGDPGGVGIRLRRAHWRIVVVPAAAFLFDFRTFTGGKHNQAQCKERARYKSPGGGMRFFRFVHDPKGSPKKSPAMILAGAQSWQIPFPAVVHIKSLGIRALLTPTSNEDPCRSKYKE